MTCCTHSGCDELFNDKRAAKDLKRYRKQGPDPTTRALIGALTRAGATAGTLLDIGGGIGAVHHELLDAGMTSATQADASAPYLRSAREEAEQRGHLDRVRFVHGDFVALAPSIEAADVVTLDRVICCYADMETLVATSAAKTRRLYGAVFPRDRWFMKAMAVALNLVWTVIRYRFRTYIHPVDAIDAALRRAGLEPKSWNRTFVWNVVVYSR